MTGNRVVPAPAVLWRLGQPQNPAEVAPGQRGRRRARHKEAQQMFEGHARFQAWQVRCYADDLAIRQWRAAVYRAGYRLRDGEGEEGYPVLIVYLLGPSDKQAFVRTMHMCGVCGSLAPLG